MMGCPICGPTPAELALATERDISEHTTEAFLREVAPVFREALGRRDEALRAMGYERTRP